MALLLVIACAGERRDYDADEGKRSVAAGVDVYDTEEDLMPCGETDEAKTTTPIGEDVKVDGVGGLQDGQVMRYEFSSLPLASGHSCEGSVWVHATEATQ